MVRQSLKSLKFEKSNEYSVEVPILDREDES